MKGFLKPATLARLLAMFVLMGFGVTPAEAVDIAKNSKASFTQVGTYCTFTYSGTEGGLEGAFEQKFGTAPCNSTCGSIDATVNTSTNSINWKWTSCGQATRTYSETFICPTGFDPSGTQCARNNTVPDPQMAQGKPCKDGTCYGNPINPGFANKFQRELDYASNGALPLSLERYYNSRPAAAVTGMGANWRHTYSRSVTPMTYSGTTTVLVHRPDGKGYYFTSISGVWTAEANVTGTLQTSGSGWTYREGDITETYNSTGRLTQIAHRNGLTQTLAYDLSSRLASVTDSFGRALTFTYTTGSLVDTVTVPGGGVYDYGYDANNNLATVTGPDLLVRTYHYEESGLPKLLTGITDERNIRYATYDYDTTGRAISTQHAGGADAVSVVYNADGTTTATDALGLARTDTFETWFGAVRTKNTAQSGANLGRTFDANGFLASMTDLNGNVTTYTHNARELEESRTEAYGTALARTISTQWHATFRLPTQIDEPGRRTVYTYDATTGDRLTETVTDLATSESRTTTRTYTTFGRVATVNGPRTDVSDVTTYAYYECTTGAQCGQVHTVTNALGQVTEVTSYNAHGNPLTIVDPNGVTTTLTYDARQRLKTRTVDSVMTTFDYDNAGQLDKVTMPDGSFLDYTYDNARRLTDIEDSAGNRIHYAYDLMGNRTAEEVFDPLDALKRKQSQVFNTLGRLYQVKDSAGQVVTQHGYDNQGNATSVTAYDGATSFETVNEFDALNRMWRSTAADDGVTQYAYNVRDQLTGVTDPRTLTTTYVMNALGDVQELDSPDTGITGYEYDAAGNRTSQIDARGIPVAYSYDALNRLTLVDYAGTAEDVTYSYDSTGQSYGKGRLTGIVDAAGTTTLIYDARGNVTSEQRVIGGSTYTTSYGYDSADRVTNITYPSGRLVTYTRNTQGQVTTVSTTVGGNTTTIAQSIVYMPFGGVKSYTLGNGVVVTRTYDTDYRLQGITDSGSATVQNLDLNYDRRGNVTLKDDLVASSAQNFAYDQVSRLNSAIGGYGTQGFTYDDVGNRLTKTGTASETYNYAGTSHHLTSLGSGTSFSYDDAGNITAKGTLSLTYNLAHRLSTASVGGVTVTSTYGASGQRIKKLASGITTVYSYDRSGQLIAEQPDSGSAREYVWLDDIPLAQASAAGLAYYHVDQLNTPQKMTDASQAVVWQASYTTFGEATVTSSGGYDNPLRFPGQYFDAETGLHQNWHRDYDPSTGRYLQSDPIGLRGGISTYGYVAANPLGAFDPDGLDLVLVGDGGDSGDLFMMAAKTWNKENCGCNKIVRASSGKEALEAMSAYAKANQGIDGLRVFSHSGSDGLYLDTSEEVASLYSRGAGWVWSFINPKAERISNIDPSWFQPEATVQLFGCNTAKGAQSFAESLSDHINRPVTGSQSGNSFSGSRNGRPGQGLPQVIPQNYGGPIYLSPEGNGWRTFGK